MPKLLITASTGAADPTRASIPFHIAANGATAAGVECVIALAGDATELVREDVAKNVRGLGIPTLTDLLVKCRSANIVIHV